MVHSYDIGFKLNAKILLLKEEMEQTDSNVESDKNIPTPATLPNIPFEHIYKSTSS